MGITIRKLENNLITLGAGVIAFGFWTVIKYTLTLLTTGESMWGDLDNDIKTATIIISWVIILLYALLYLWLGLSARAEGSGKHKSILYLIVIGIIVVVSVVVIALEILMIVLMKAAIGRMIITLIIDLTRIVFLIQILYSSVKLRKLRRLKSAESDKEGEAA